MRESPLCVFYLRKGKGAGSSPQIDHRTSRCPNLTGKFLYSAAAKERINSPCTNVPIVCPLCPSTSPTVWKYNMKSHLAKNHSSVVRGSDLFQQYGISESEKAALKLQWEQRHKVQRRKRKTAPTQLPVSDMHSSRYAFGYVHLHLMLLPLIFYSTTQSSTGSEQNKESDDQRERDEEDEVDDDNGDSSESDVEEEWYDREAEDHERVWYERAREYKIEYYEEKEDGENKREEEEEEEEEEENETKDRKNETKKGENERKDEENERDGYALLDEHTAQLANTILSCQAQSPPETPLTSTTPTFACAVEEFATASLLAMPLDVPMDVGPTQGEYRLAFTWYSLTLPFMDRYRYSSPFIRQSDRIYYRSTADEPWPYTSNAGHDGTCSMHLRDTR